MAIRPLKIMIKMKHILQKKSMNARVLRCSKPPVVRTVANSRKSSVHYWLVATLTMLFATTAVIPQDFRLERKLYQDLNYQIDTPAFAKKRGFTKYRSMMKFLQKIVAQNPQIKMQFIGKSALGRKIPLLTFGNPDNAKVRLWMQGGLHGNEPASSEGMLFFISQMNNSQLKKYLSQVYLAVLPMANIDGYQIQNRFDAHDCDLNRDQTRYLCHDSQFLKRAFLKFNPHVAIDFHEFRPYRSDFLHFQEQGVVTYYDAMFLYSGNLNIPLQIRSNTKKILVDPLKKRLTAAGFATNDYFSTQRRGAVTKLRQGSASLRSSAGNFALSNALAILMEIRGVNLGRVNFKRRVWITYFCAKSYLELAARNRLKIKQTVQRSIALTRSLQHPIFVKSVATPSTIKIKAIDRYRQQVIPLTMPGLQLSQQKPTLVRKRPSGYIILAKEKRAVKNLKILGLQLEDFSTNREVTVESLIITDAETNRTIGDQQNRVATQVQKIKKRFKKKAFFLSLRQENANYAVVALEPEGNDSFVSNGVIQVDRGKEYSVYRYIGQ